ncbi:MAG: GntR family transcriptional regulator [Proteobacteria bacterium]|nr:GntR family transcriptional regulator [Pseudomonadota bacterium]
MVEQLFSKVATPITAVEHVHRELRHAIVHGRIEPGTRLVETQLAEMLGVSRTPIREALSRLETEGVVLRGQGGLVVGDTASERAVILGIRQRLEGFAARLAAERMTASELKELEAACTAGAATIEEMSLEERRMSNFRFHLLLASGSRSRRLEKLIEEYYDYSVTAETLPYYSPERMRQHQNQHRDIVEAIRAKDGALAERVVFEHLQNVQAVQTELVEKI